MATQPRSLFLSDELQFSVLPPFEVGQQSQQSSSFNRYTLLGFLQLRDTADMSAPAMSDPFNTSITNENQLALDHLPHAHQRRPSSAWFESPSHMDGASDPPFFFLAVEEVHNTFLFHGGDLAVLRDQQLAQLTPVPVNPIPPALSYSMESVASWSCKQLGNFVSLLSFFTPLYNSSLQIL
ncbi:hypothetical protein D9619_007618 [Psilocybe cf. subviscida]|uniref:Uncharacterized protein n=1 Tax=Psilocybe cf. subviscida TaxID=2480587 RepID=A0A8H5B2A8_9AGAR|nr:hypothetical protein D9619_007618 [Psilocybe cf. subviscida]